MSGHGISSRAVRIALLGAFVLVVGGQTATMPHTGQRLLAFLALQRRPVSRNHVAGSLWPETSEAHAAASLRSTLWRLGRRDLIETADGQLRLAPHVTVDLYEGLDLASAILDPASGPPTGPVDLGLLTEDLLPDWSDDWVLFPRERLRQLRLHALEGLCGQLAARGRYAQAVEAGLAAVEADPLRESAHRALIGAHLAEGNVGEAIRQYRSLERLLRQELDVEPTETFPELLRELGPGRSSLHAVPPRAASRH